MIVPDVNLLVHAYNSESRVHAAARAWWEEQLNDTRPVGLAAASGVWAVWGLESQPRFLSLSTVGVSLRVRLAATGRPP